MVDGQTLPDPALQIEYSGGGYFGLIVSDDPPDEFVVSY